MGCRLWGRIESDTTETTKQQQQQQAFASKHDGFSLTFTVDCVFCRHVYHGLGLLSQMDSAEYFLTYPSFLSVSH